LVTRLVTSGVAVAPITLHTGVSSQEAGEGPQPEWFHVPASTARLVDHTRAHGGRVVATGTTVTRALESAVVDGTVRESWGWTDRVVTPAHPAVAVNGLITGWHDAEASHLLLVEAIAGTDLAQAAYDGALEGGYRWHEFGDSALFLP
jgi:S-adenosylmethionine:tRNA ribosyltransferase-isomerase